MSLKVAQDSDYLGKNLWKWSVWIEGSIEELDYINSVTYILHPSFANPVRTVDDRASNFKLESQGWGMFLIRINVLNKDSSTVDLAHELNLAYPQQPPDERSPLRVIEQATAPQARALASDEVERKFRNLSKQYEETRRSMPAGDLRTKKMAAIAGNMRSMAGSGFQLLDKFVNSPSAGDRLVAVSILEEIPDQRYLTWLADRIETEKPFIGYHASRALLEAAHTLRSSHRNEVQEAIARARNSLNQLDWKDPNQVATLERAEKELTGRR